MCEPGRAPRSRLAILSGAGDLPAEAARCAEASGREVVRVVFEGLTDPAPMGLPGSEIELALGQLEALAAALSGAGCDQVLLVGHYSRELLSGAREILKPDAAAACLLSGLTDRSEDGLMAAVIGWLEGRGFALADQRTILASWLAPEGVLTERRPSAAARRDLSAGLLALRSMERAGSGQCVVVQRGRVVARETAAGTNDAIRRGGAAAGPGTTVVKGARSGQDLRLDLPTIGSGTFEAMAQAGAAALAFEAGKTLLVGGLGCLASAEAAGLTVWSYPGSEPFSGVGRVAGDVSRGGAS